MENHQLIVDSWQLAVDIDSRQLAIDNRQLTERAISNFHFLTNNWQ